MNVDDPNKLDNEHWDTVVRPAPKPPELPPGVKMFDPRRIRRRERKATMMRLNRTLSFELAKVTEQKDRLAAALAKANAALRGEPERTEGGIILPGSVQMVKGVK